MKCPLERTLADRETSPAGDDALLRGQDAFLARDESLLGARDTILARGESLLVERDGFLAHAESLLGDRNASLATDQSFLGGRDAFPTHEDALHDGRDGTLVRPARSRSASVSIPRRPDVVLMKGDMSRSRSDGSLRRDGSILAGRERPHSDLGLVRGARDATPCRRDGTLCGKDGTLCG